MPDSVCLMEVLESPVNLKSEPINEEGMYIISVVMKLGKRFFPIESLG